MNLAVASGKGGTGKTTIAVNLACFLADSGLQVQYLDCDVEEPNGYVFLEPRVNHRKTAFTALPVIDNKICTSCGECSAKCQFKALVNLPGGNAIVFPELCHSCGLCALVCPEKAITEGEREIGVIETGVGTCDVKFVQGVLRVGEPMAGPLIRQVKKEAVPEHIRIIDCPPGTSCPVVEAISGADGVVLVTEPTPFGLHDLKIMVTVVRSLGKPLGIVINRDQGEFPPLARYVEAHNLAVLTKIPEDREIARAYSTGSLVYKALPAYREHLRELSVNFGRVLGRTNWKKEVCAA